MKKTIKAILSIGLLCTFVQPALADSPSQPKLVSFTMTPDTVDIATANTVVTLNLTVSNPTGIASTQTQATVSDGASNSLTTTLYRTDTPVNTSLVTVTFKGTLTIPATVPAGPYFATASPITALNADGKSGYATNALSATTTSKVVGAEDALLVRNSGNLNFNYSTFAGPAYNKTVGSSFINPKYSSVSAPIWKVGESFHPSDYYELSVPTLVLKVSSNTPSTCSTSDGITLQLVSAGTCAFAVYTDKTLDYQYQKNDQSVAITAARTKPTYDVGSIPTQSSTTLPLSIVGPSIFGPFGLVLPVTATPTVCNTSATFIKVISGGTCTLNYSTPASASFLASDVYSLTFQITRTTQTLTFTTPVTAQLSSKVLTLSAIASSGGAVTFQSNSPTICSITGNSLNLQSVGNCQVEAMQAGTATIAPASVNQSIAVTGALAPVAKKPAVKKIVCVKSGKSKTFFGTKCPAGYKVKK